MELTRRADHQGPGCRCRRCRGRHHAAGRGRQRRDARRRGPAQMVEGALPLLRHRLRGDGRGQGRPGGRHPRRHPGRGQPRHQLRQGLLPLQDHVRRRPADQAAAADARRRLRQGRRVQPISWDQAFDIMAEKYKAALKAKGPAGVGMFGSGQWTIWEGYAANKLFKARLPLQQHRPQRPPLHGLGGVRLHAHLRHGRADGLLRRHRGRRRVRALGLEHGRDAPDPVDPGHRPPPVLSRT